MIGQDGSELAACRLLGRRGRTRTILRLLVDATNQLAIGAGDISPGGEARRARTARRSSGSTGRAGFPAAGCAIGSDGAGRGGEIGVRQRHQVMPRPEHRVGRRRPLLRYRRHRATICGRRSSGASERKKIAVSSGSGGVVAALTR